MATAGMVTGIIGTVIRAVFTTLFIVSAVNGW